MYANSAKSDQTRHSVASYLGFQCLLMSHKNDARIQWVNTIKSGVYIKGSRFIISK